MTPRLKGSLIAALGAVIILLGFGMLNVASREAESSAIGYVIAFVLFAGGVLLWRLGRKTIDPDWKPKRSFQRKRSASE